MLGARCDEVEVCKVDVEIIVETRVLEFGIAAVSKSSTTTFLAYRQTSDSISVIMIRLWRSCDAHI